MSKDCLAQVIDGMMRWEVKPAMNIEFADKVSVALKTIFTNMFFVTLLNQTHKAIGTELRSDLLEEYEDETIR